jgi:5'-3' exonuclease
MHLICSNDKDMYQILNNQNIFQYYSYGKNNTLLNYTEALKKYFSVNYDLTTDINPLLLTIMMAISGDKIDDVPGVHGIGPKKCLKLLDTSVISDLEYDNIIKNIFGDAPLFTNQNTDTENKDLLKIINNEELIRKSIKLISYECLVYWLERACKYHQKPWINYIDSTISKKEIMFSDTKTLMECVGFINDFVLREYDIQFLF